jgi:DNA-binding beta-propeller fold protein YncE
MNTLRGYVPFVLLLVLAIACGGLSTDSTPTPENVAPQDNAPQIEPTNTPSTPVSSLTAESIWTFDGNPDPLMGPVDITLDPAGNLYIADTNHFRIVKIDPEGNQLTEWGRDGEGQGQFWTPNGVAVDGEGKVYVADGGVNHRIQIFDSEGNFLSLWGSRGNGDGQFDQPNDIVLDAQGNIFVVDYKNYRIQKFDPDGNFLIAWGSQGTEDGQFGRLNRIMVDEAGNVYVSDDTNHRITKFDNNGQFLLKWENLPCNFPTTSVAPAEIEAPAGMWLDPQGRLFVVDSAWNRVCAFDENGEFLGGWGEKGTEAGQLGFPIGIVGDNAGNIYVLEYSNNRVQKFAIK